MKRQADISTRKRELEAMAALAMKALDISAEEAGWMQQVARGLYEEIAADLEIETGSLSRDEVLELALDAGRLEQVLERGSKPDSPRALLVAKIRKAYKQNNGYELIKTIIGPAFVYGTYEAGKE